MLWGTAVALGACLVIGVTIRRAEGFASRVPPRSLRLAAAVADTNRRRAECLNFTTDEIRRGRSCRIGPASGASPVFALIGDSHAEAIFPGLEEAARRTGVTGTALLHSACLPLDGVRRVSQEPRAARCTAVVQASLERIASDTGIRVVYLVARWALYTDSSPLRARERFDIVDDSSDASSGEENRRVFARGMQRTIARLHGKQIVLVASVPEWRVSVPIAAALASWQGRTMPEHETFALMQERQRVADVVFTDAARDARISILRPASWLCANAICPATRSDTVLYRDYDHLTRTAAISLSGIFDVSLRAHLALR